MKPVIRKYRSDDYGFVSTTWLKSYQGNVLAKEKAKIDPDTFKRDTLKLIDKLLIKCPPRVLADPNDDNVVWAWACVDEDKKILHYLCASINFHRAELSKGLFDTLVADLLPARLPHTFNLYREWRFTGLALPEGWYYDPYVLIGYL